jgi:hypothetical protein
MGDGNKGKENNRMDNSRKPNLLCTAEQNAWFTYPYWLDDDKAPDFAKTVAIHDKMGYDPCEMLIDSRIKFPRLTMAKKLLQKKCGFRTLMDIISLEPERIKGSHGRIVTEKEDQPIWIGPQNFCNDESMTVANLHQSIERFFTEPSL